MTVGPHKKDRKILKIFLEFHQQSLALGHYPHLQWKESFKNWDWQLIRVQSRLDCWGDTRIWNFVSVFLANALCIDQTKIAVSCVVRRFSPGHGNSERQALTFPFCPVTQHFLAVMIHRYVGSISCLGYQEQVQSTLYKHASQTMLYYAFDE